MNAQVNMLRKRIVDNFACGGGASTGIELALGRPVDDAINHDREAIAMHKKNHPYTKHYCEDVFAIDPKTVAEGCPVELAWFSPDCKNFSRAKGDVPVDKNIRGLSWVILRWGMEVRPETMMMENVKEIREWGPLIPKKDEETGRIIKKVYFSKDSKSKWKEAVAEPGEIVPHDQMIWYPDPKRKGETFKGFVRMLTTGIEPNHPALLEAYEFLEIEPDSEKAQMLIKGLGYDVDFKLLKACDYGAPTIRERLFGVMRSDGQPIVWPEPTHGKPGSGLLPFRTAAEIIDWTLPCPSIFESKEKIKEQYGVTAVRPLAKNTMKRIAKGTDGFVIKNQHPFIVQVNHGGDNFRGQNINEPLTTITGKHGYGIVDPIMTPVMTAIGHTGFTEDRSYGIEEPIRTVVSKAEQCLVAPTLIQYHGETSGNEVRGQKLDEPIMTVDSSPRYGLASAFLSEYFGNAQDGISPSGPLHTVTGKDREALTVAFMSKYYSGGHDGAGNSLEDPLNTITSVDHNALALAYLSKFYKTGIGQDINEPLHTITTSPGHFGAVEVKLVKAEPGHNLNHWPEVRAMLNEYCGYNLAADEVLIFKIRGVWYFISDIGLRMLTPRELYNAQGFPQDYIIELEYNGKAYSKAKQIANCGNSVCPVLPYMLVKANLPYSCCKRKLQTMRQLEEEIAV